jgi:hypothetical protein
MPESFIRRTHQIFTAVKSTSHIVQVKSAIRYEDKEHLLEWLILTNLASDRSTADSSITQPTTRPRCGGRKKPAMNIRIQVVVDAGNGEPEKIEEIAQLELSSLRLARRLSRTTTTVTVMTGQLPRRSSNRP